MSDNGRTSPSVFITGATDGLGKAAALLLAERGYRVLAAGRSPERRAQLDALAREKKLPLETIALDVCDEGSVQQAVREVLAKAGAVDVLINNAGVGYFATVEELRMDDLRRQFETNFFGAVRVTQALLPHMRQRRRGRILMMSSLAGLVSPPTYGAYSASKFALEGLSNALRLEMYPFGIEVILIEPGYIITGFQQVAADHAEPYVDGAKNGPYAGIYAGTRNGAERGRKTSKTTPEDCAQVILQAIQSPRPKARYTVTRLAKNVAFGKRLLSDRVMDAGLRRIYGIKRDA